MRQLIALLLLCMALPAQVVRLANHAPTAWSGWIRRNADVRPPHDAGEIDGLRYVVGKQHGAELWHVDVYCPLKAGERRTADLADSREIDFALQPLPSDLSAWLGGPVLLDGKPMQLLSLEADGAAWVSRWQLRTGELLVTDLWVTWYPDQPAIAYGQAMVNASNPASPKMVDDATGLDLRFGDALVLIPGKVGNELATGTLADGQARCTLPVFVWPRHLRPGDFETVVAAKDLGVGCVLIKNLWATGNPNTPPDFDAAKWASRFFAPSLHRMHTWEPNLLGPSLVSGSAGQQEDQFFHAGGEALELPGCEWIRLANALKSHGEKPANHREPNGDWLSLDRFPGLLQWDSRPNFRTARDTLGKPRPLTWTESRGRWGPDMQHLLVQSLSSSVRIMGGPVETELLQNVARNYLFMRTAFPGWGTSGTESARELAYEFHLMVELDRNCPDRMLVEACLQRCRERVEQVVLPLLDGRDYVVAFNSDARLGPGRWAIAWQECFFSWAADVYGERFKQPALRAAALRVARRMLNEAWTQVDGTWLSRANISLDGLEAHADGSFNDYGMPLCVATVLRHEPENERAVAIWKQLRSEGAYRWVPTLRIR